MSTTTPAGDHRGYRLLGALYRDCRDIALTFDEGSSIKVRAELLMVLGTS